MEEAQTTPWPDRTVEVALSHTQIGVLVLLVAVLALALWRRTVANRRAAASGAATARTPAETWVASHGAQLGLDVLPRGFALAAAVLWFVIFFLLVGGVIVSIVTIVATLFDPPAGDDTLAASRFGLLTLAALTATLGATVALPFTMLRTRFNARQTRATEDGLVTDRINAAVASLGAERVVKDTAPGASGDAVTVERTIPNMEVRIGAIYALERIARENLAFHVQVMEILCAYIRQNAPAEGARTIVLPPMPEGEKAEMGTRGGHGRSGWSPSPGSYARNSPPRPAATSRRP